MMGAGELVSELSSHLTEEFTKLGTLPSQFCHENYLAYKSALDRIAEHSTVYKPLLNSIASSFDAEVSALLERQRQATLQETYEVELNLADETLANLHRREAQLTETVTKLQSERTTLTESIASLRELVADISAQSLLVEEDVFQHRVIEGLTLEQMTNANILSRELMKLENHHRSMVESQGAGFVPREKFEETRRALLKKEEVKEERGERLVELHGQVPSLKQAVEALQALDARQEEGEGGPSFEELLAVVGTAIERGRVAGGASHFLELFEEEDPAQEREAEEKLAYVEQLEEFLREGDYRTAAIHAANSPGGFLRTMATLEEFRSLEEEEGVEGVVEGPGPLFTYCSTLMDSVPLYSPVPEDQSYECVGAALRADRPDSIAQWIANRHATLSRRTAELLLCSCQCRGRCDCESGTLAIAVYREIGDHPMIVHSLARQGALYRALHYAKSQKLGEEALMSLLSKLPSVDLAALLVLEEEFHIGEVLECLLANHNDSVFIGLLKLLDDNNDLRSVLVSDGSHEGIDWTEFSDLCVSLGEEGIAEEIQAFAISTDAIASAAASLIEPED